MWLGAARLTCCKITPGPREELTLLSTGRRSPNLWLSLKPTSHQRETAGIGEHTAPYWARSSRAAVYSYTVLRFMRQLSSGQRASLRVSLSLWPGAMENAGWQKGFL